MSDPGNPVDQSLLDSASELPDAVVGGVAAYRATAKDENGVEYAVVVMSLLFQVQEGGLLGIQHFVMDQDTAGLLRQALKNPPKKG